MKKRLLVILIGISVISLLAAPLLLAGCDGEETPTTTTPSPTPTITTPAGPTPPDQDKIVIGAARPLSGPLVQIGDFAFGPVMTIWAEEVNARGGINVAGGFRGAHRNT